jgi:hypothetical protein
MAISTTGDFKLNNNYRAHYARLIMHQEPDLDGIFELRRSKADILPPEDLRGRLRAAFKKDKA